MNAHIKQIHIMSLEDILRADISEQCFYFYNLCILMDYHYQMDTDGDTVQTPAYGTCIQICISYLLVAPDTTYEWQRVNETVQLLSGLVCLLIAVEDRGMIQ